MWNADCGMNFKLQKPKMVILSSIPHSEIRIPQLRGLCASAKTESYQYISEGGVRKLQ